MSNCSATLLVRLAPLLLLLFCTKIFADDRIKLVQLQRSSSSLFLLIEAESPIDYELRNIPGTQRFLLDLYAAEYFKVINNFVAGLPSDEYQPCMSDMQVIRFATRTQVVIDVPDGMSVTAYKAKASHEEYFRIVIHVYSEVPVSGRCLARQDTAAHTQSAQTDTVEPGRYPVAPDRMKPPVQTVKKTTDSPAKSAFRLSSYAMYDYITGLAAEQDWPNVLKHPNNKELRRFKLDMKGIIGDFNYLLGVDLRDAFVTEHEVKLYRGYVGYAGLKPLKVSLGLQPEPFGMEKSTSSKYMTFMERSLPILLSPEDNRGVVFSFNDQINHFGEIGYFVARNYPEGGNVERAATGRFGLSPINNKGRLLYFGMSSSVREPKLGNLRFSTRPEAHMAKRMFDSGIMVDVERLFLANYELALVYSAISLQSEFATAKVRFSNSIAEKRFDAYYVMISGFLTGESRHYARGNFGRVKPRRRLGKGIGAWELALRSSAIRDDLGQELWDITFAVNWYLNKYARVMLNWIEIYHYDTVEERQGHLLQSRIQFRF